MVNFQLLEWKLVLSKELLLRSFSKMQLKNHKKNISLRSLFIF